MASFIISDAKGGAAGGVTTDGVNTTGANLIVVNVAFYPAETGNPTLTDSKSNTWTALTPHTTANGFYRQKLYYCYSPSVGASHTFTLSGTNIFSSLNMCAFSVGGSSTVGSETGNSSNSASSLACGSLTPDQNDCLLIAAMNSGDTAGAVSIDLSYTIPSPGTIDGAAGSYQGSSIAYLFLGTAAAKNPTFNTTDATGIATGVVYFRDAAAGGGGGGGSVGHRIIGGWGGRVIS